MISVVRGRNVPAVSCHVRAIRPPFAPESDRRTLRRTDPFPGRIPSPIRRPIAVIPRVNRSGRRRSGNRPAADGPRDSDSLPVPVSKRGTEYHPDKLYVSRHSRAHRRRRRVRPPRTGFGFSEVLGPAPEPRTPLFVAGVAVFYSPRSTCWYRFSTESRGSRSPGGRSGGSNPTATRPPPLLTRCRFGHLLLHT